MGKKLFFLLVLVSICVLFVSETSARQSEIATTRQSEIATTRQSEIATTRQSEIATERQSEIATTRQSEIATTRQSEIATERQSEVATERQSKIATERQSEVATERQSEIATTSIWTEDFQYALRKSQESAKPIFMLFTGSDWCPPCMALDNEVFTQPEFAEYAIQNFILFKADRPRFIEQSEALVEQNQELFRRFEIVGVPTIKIINYRENVLATTGYRAGGVLNYINHIKELLK